MIGAARAVQGVDWRTVLALGGVAFGLYYVATRDAAAVVASVGDVVKKIGAGITFSESDMPPPVKLTQTAEQRRDEYIRKGYMVKDSRGVYVITPLGEMFIRSGGVM